MKSGILLRFNKCLSKVAVDSVKRCVNERVISSLVKATVQRCCQCNVSAVTTVIATQVPRSIPSTTLWKLATIGECLAIFLVDNEPCNNSKDLAGREAALSVWRVIERGCLTATTKKKHCYLQVNHSKISYASSGA